MAGIDKEYLSDHKLFRVRNKKLLLIFPLIAVLVAIIVFWWLKLTGITITGDAFCGADEHTHTEECYRYELICDYKDAGTAVAAQTTQIDLTEAEADSDTTETETAEAESTNPENHIHTDECYRKELICTIPEHRHSAECFPDKNADKETKEDWLATFEDVEITNDVAKNLLSIASTQIGYKESVLNYEYSDFSEKNGYTRYGEWYGSPYGEWNSIFVSFCLNYANANNADELMSASAEAMRMAWEERRIYSSADTYSCSLGDVIFFDTDSDGKADRTGIVMYSGDDMLISAEGDVNGAVDRVIYESTASVMGYGMTGELYAAEHITESSSAQQEDSSQPTTDNSGELNLYIPNATAPEEAETTPSVFNSNPLILMSADDHNITYTSDLEGEVINAVFKNQAGTILGDNDTVYIGESYIISLEFSEINTGTTWTQFRYDADGYLTYHVPSNLHCDPFDSWHTISATTENGTIKDVGEYFLDENGLLKVRFFDDTDGVNFIDKYSNVDFTIDFNATVASTQSGSSTEVVFNDKINIQLNVDGGAGMTVSKTHGEYDSTNNEIEFTIRVEATHGVVHDLIVDDEIWEKYHALLDTIVVTDLDGNVLKPQPTISNHPGGAAGGFRLSGFPDFSAGNGYLIKYKAAVNDDLLGSDTVGMWNGVYSTAADSNGNFIENWTEDWVEVELEKMVKDGKQAVVEDADGNKIPVIEWQIGIRKTATNLQGTVVVDTLGEGLAYYTGTPILVKRYDEWGNRLADSYISWNDVTINGNSMEFPLPDSYACDIVYYTTYEELDAGETKNYTNKAKVTINGKEEQTNGSADVVGFIPYVNKTARGDDGEYVYFTIEADVPGVIKDWGHFFLTDLAAVWNYNGNSLYIENIPQDMVVTATTESGRTITFTPYKAGGSVENTFIIVSPSMENGHHSFNILFNTADRDFASSKWILDEDSTLKITYKLPFDAKTGTEWEGELKGDQTLEDVLLQGNKLSNEVYFNYTETITTVGSASYEYAPMITKKSVTHEDGTIDYTVVFNNTVPGSGGGDGYLNNSIASAWFEDTFDERMEYVPGSLTVTCYSPWQNNLWVMKYKYNGTVTGNTIYAAANDMVFYDYNEEATQYGWDFMLGTRNFNDYYQWSGQGGNFVFTYSLKLKDEYLYTTEQAQIELDNTAELTWSNDGSSGPVTETTEFSTGLVEKTAVQKDSKLDFDIHINRNSLDILPGSDTLTIEDTMTPNLSVYWDTIKLLYEDKNGNWIDFDSAQSQYTFKVTYDPATNRLTFVIPDSLHIRIDYTTLITESGLVSINNSVNISGKAQISDIVDALFRVEEHSGGASGSNNSITLLKQDGLTNARLPGATFILYGTMGDPNATIPLGVSPTIITEDGTLLKYIGSYTTGEDGTVFIETQYLTVGGPYALVERVAPEGYELLTTPVYFYFYDTDPNGVIPTATTLVAVENFSGSFIIPETGGAGLFITAIIGFAVTAFPVLYSLIRRKRKRRLPQ